MNQPRQRIKETLIGQWLKSKAPHILETIGDVLPDRGALGVLKRMVDKDDTIPQEARQELLDLIVDQDHRARDHRQVDL